MIEPWAFADAGRGFQHQAALSETLYLLLLPPSCTRRCPETITPTPSVQPVDSACGCANVIGHPNIYRLMWRCSEGEHKREGPL
jgi:hypothetical protein